MAEEKGWRKIMDVLFSRDEVIRIGEKKVIHFPRCLNCREPMDWIQVFERGELIHESAVCSKCSTIELRAVSIEGTKHLMKIHQDTKKKGGDREGETNP